MWRHASPRKPTPDSCKRLQASFQGTCRERLKRVKNYCDRRGDYTNSIVDDSETGSGNDSIVNVFSYRHRHTVLMYCSVHKVASTFWVRVFRYLHNDTSMGHVMSPDHVSKYEAHLAPFKASRPLALAYVTRTLRPEDEDFRFLFTREPYHRLWAVYVDKFVLPDYYFWTVHALAIKDMGHVDSDAKSSRQQFTLCLEITFEEFVRYVIQDESSPLAPMDDHLLPITRTCDPCTFQPHFIGRVENMTEDSAALLERLGLGHVSPKKNFKERALHHIRTVTEFVYDTVIERGHLRHCVSEDNLQARLLRGFILGGYLPPEDAEVRRTSVGTSLSALLKMMEELFLGHDRTETEVLAQRERFFVNAYDALPSDLLPEIRDYYRQDFEAFGYDPEPQMLFKRLLEEQHGAEY
nr:hypothetical protein BaRGS_024712 [Batillaria attramentaria]